MPRNVSEFMLGVLSEEMDNNNLPDTDSNPPTPKGGTGKAKKKSKQQISHKASTSRRVALTSDDEIEDVEGKEPEYEHRNNAGTLTLTSKAESRSSTVVKPRDAAAGSVFTLDSNTTENSNSSRMLAKANEMASQHMQVKACSQSKRAKVEPCDGNGNDGDHEETGDARDHVNGKFNDQVNNRASSTRQGGQIRVTSAQDSGDRDAANNPKDVTNRLPNSLTPKYADREDAFRKVAPHLASHYNVAQALYYTKYPPKSKQNLLAVSKLFKANEEKIASLTEDQRTECVNEYSIALKLYTQDRENVDAAERTYEENQSSSNQVQDKFSPNNGEIKVLDKIAKDTHVVPADFFARQHEVMKVMTQYQSLMYNGLCEMQKITAGAFEQVMTIMGNDVAPQSRDDQ